MTRALRRIWNRLFGSFFGARRDSDLAEELDSHIEFLADENMRRGCSPDEALRHARLAFGSLESAKDAYRDQRGLPFLDTTAQDLRYAFRVMRKNPGFSAVAILSPAIGIGANTPSSRSSIRCSCGPSGSSSPNGCSRFARRPLASELCRLIRCMLASGPGSAHRSTRSH